MDVDIRVLGRMENLHPHSNRFKRPRPVVCMQKLNRIIQANDTCHTSTDLVSALVAIKPRTPLDKHLHEANSENRGSQDLSLDRHLKLPDRQSR